MKFKMAAMKERLHEMLDILSHVEMQTFEYAENLLKGLGYSEEEILTAFKWYLKEPKVNYEQQELRSYAMV